MSKRRDFLKLMLAGSAAAVANPVMAKSNDWVNVTILHTNDMHSRIEPFPLSDPKYAGLGGFERLSATINEIRQEKEKDLAELLSVF